MKTDAGQYRERIPRWLFILIAALLVVGTILSWWGTRAKRVFHSGPRAEAILSGRVPAAKPSFSLDQTLTQGRQLNTTYCAGCHAERERLIGPSYHLIAASYRALQGRLGGGADVISLLAWGITHPRAGWDNYPPGPQDLVPTPGERATLAYWILHDAPGTSVAIGRVEKQ